MLALLFPGLLMGGGEIVVHGPTIYMTISFAAVQATSVSFEAIQATTISFRAVQATEAEFSDG